MLPPKYLIIALVTSSLQGESSGLMMSGSSSGSSGVEEVVAFTPVSVCFEVGVVLTVEPG